MPYTLEQLNAAPATEALVMLDGLYEHSPWIAEQALRQRPFVSLAALKHTLTQVLHNAPQAAQVALIRAHPELAGKAMVSRTLMVGGDIKADMPLRAPFDGRVITRNITRGEVVETNQKLFTVANLTDVWVIGNVPEKDVRFISKDQKVNVVLAAYPHAIFTGTITYVGDVLDPATRTMSLRVSVPNPERLLKPEMFAIIRVYAPPNPDELSIPLEAVQNGSAGAMVFVQRGPGEFEARTVKVGSEQGDLVSVLDGVSAGEQVVTKGSFALKSEMERHKIEPSP